MRRVNILKILLKILGLLPLLFLLQACPLLGDSTKSDKDTVAPPQDTIVSDVTADTTLPDAGDHDGTVSSCFATGCSGEICADHEVASDCVYLKEYECLKFSTCGEFGENGGCGWEQTQAYLDCLAKPECEDLSAVDFGDCKAIVGWVWAGDACVLKGGCSCMDYCDQIYASEEECNAACGVYTNECAEAGGACTSMFPAGSNGDAMPRMLCPPNAYQVFLAGCKDGEVCCMPVSPDDVDADGYSVDQGDCDDNNANINPGMEEACNDKLDNDCDGQIDEGCTTVTCGGFVGTACPEGLFCKFELGTCKAADQLGTCTKIPKTCTEDYLPVCGCDGNTYANLCMAESVGMSIDYLAACNNTTCKAVDPKAFGDCANLIGFAFTGQGCELVSGCDCGQYCEHVFATYALCEAACLSYKN